jgi:hypothetical protein
MSISSWLTSSTINDVRKADSTTITTSPSLVHFVALKLVLQLPGLDCTIRSILNSYLNGTLASDIQGISNALSGIGDVSSHPTPLNDCSLHQPHTISLQNKLFDRRISVPPVLTPPSSPKESIITTELEPGSEILFFDDGGALVYHAPEPSSTSSPEPVSYLTRSMAIIPLASILESSNSFELADVTHPVRQMSFMPMTPIIEGVEPSDCQDRFSCTSEDDLTDSEASDSAIFLQTSDREDTYQVDLVTSLAPSVDNTPSCVLFDVAAFDVVDNQVLPHVRLEAAYDTVELGVPIPRTDSLEFHGLPTIQGKLQPVPNNPVSFDDVVFDVPEKIGSRATTWIDEHWTRLITRPKMNRHLR